MPTKEEIYKIAREIAEKMCVDEYYLHEDINDVYEVLKVLFQDYRIVSKGRLHDYYKSETRQANAPSSDPSDAYEIQDARSQLLVLENLFTKKEFEEDE